MECASGYVVVCKRLFGGGLQHFSVSPSPLVTYWVLTLVGSCLGLGLGGFGTKGLGTGLDNCKKIRFIKFSLNTVDCRSSRRESSIKTHLLLRFCFSCHLQQCHWWQTVIKTNQYAEFHTYQTCHAWEELRWGVSHDTKKVFLISIIKCDAHKSYPGFERGPWAWQFQQAVTRILWAIHMCIPGPYKKLKVHKPIILFLLGILIHIQYTLYIHESVLKLSIFSILIFLKTVKIHQPANLI